MDLFIKHMSLTLKHRGIILNWMMEVVDEYNLKHNTFQLAVYILDKYLIVEDVNISVKEIQGISVVCIVIASKLMDDNIFTIKNADYISSNQYGQQFLLQKEKQILEKLGYQVNYKTVWYLIKKNGHKISTDIFRITYYLTCIMLIHPDYISIPVNELTDKIIKFAIIIKKNHLMVPKLSKKNVIYKYLYCMWSIATKNTKLSEIKNIFTNLGIYYVLKNKLLEIGPIFEGNINGKYGGQLNIIPNINLLNYKSYKSKTYEIDNDIGIPKEVLNEIVKLVSIKKHPNIINLDHYYYDLDNNKLNIGFKIKCSVVDKLSQSPTKKLKFKMIRQFLTGIKHLHDNKIIYKNLSIDNLFLDKNNNLKISGFLSPELVSDFQSSDELYLLYKKYYLDKKYIWSCGCIIGHILLGHSLFESTDEEKIQFTELDERYPKVSNIIHKMLSPFILLRPDIDIVVKYFNNVKPLKNYKQSF
ncbi:cyclin-domain fused to serine-threonine kinase [Acanthamoeba polyphaga moumouvirus]|uniref:Cyclin-domain fused to serine-threonine kinase n=1 Tax=Acanthamoeba polyphaga moumouvirus TaxID=1269028 RepID=L7RDU1_9VIRU|nr:cyclin-domain fused to serine-threonine kinase [Acanthamoeba polyphaga moumouvirus]AGC02258.1 cyclin-domain fused to serine-threonine kinase [Acanthamoeba polyphaga moumouvirus]